MVTPHSFENSGAHSSPADSRDFKDHEVREALGMAAAPIHKQVNIPDVSAVPVIYQGQTPSCVPTSRTWAFQYKVFLKTGNVISLSARMGYALDKKADGIPTTQGTYPRVDLAQFQTKGECTTVTLPNDVTLPLDQYQYLNGPIPQAALDEGKILVYVTYMSVPLNVDSIKAAIDNWSVVLACVSVGSEWWTSKSGVTSWSAADILPVRTPNPIVSGHQIAIYGYDDTYFYFANSFGNTWGNNGYGTMLIKDYIPFFKECWAIEELPKVITDALKKNPVKDSDPVIPVPDPLPQTPVLVWIQKVIAFLKVFFAR